MDGILNINLHKSKVQIYIEYRYTQILVYREKSTQAALNENKTKEYNSHKENTGEKEKHKK